MPAPVRLLVIPVLAWSLTVLLAAVPAAAQPQFCTEAVFPLLSQGYAALRAGQDDQARQHFEAVVKIDRYNPYALNNLAVLAERQGNLKEAMALLLAAETFAVEYLFKADEICEGGGLCLAVSPFPAKGQSSSISSIIRSNIMLVRTKLGKAHAPEK